MSNRKMLIFSVYALLVWLTISTGAVIDDSNWSEKPVSYTAENLGINLPWLDLHNGGVATNWLNVKYDSKLIDQDLAAVRAMGITKIRSFCPLESVYNFNGTFVLNENYARNLDDFLDIADNYGIDVICVMGDGNYDGRPNDLDGKLRWELIQNPEGLQIYKNAYIDYINRFKNHKNILMWETVNEPYGSITWSYSAKELNVTQDQVHVFLLQSYQTIKPLVGNVPVGISDLEEEEQEKYQIFSNPDKRRLFIDDVTDIYAMHIYRNNASQVADFRSLTNKPKWVVELGAYNYDDPYAIEHPIPASNELFDTEKNYNATIQISKKLSNSGFTLIMPWSLTSNNGMVQHNPDGSHTLLKLAQFMKGQLTDHSDTKGDYGIKKRIRYFLDKLIYLFRFNFDIGGSIYTEK